MHLRLSIVFEKFLKEKNKSKKDRSFAPPAAESRALPEREGEPPPPRANSSLDPPFSRARPCQTEGREIGRNEPLRFPARPSFRPYYGSDFFSVEGNRQKGRRFTPFVENFSCVSNRGCPDLPIKSCMRGVPAAHEIFIGSLRF